MAIEDIASGKKDYAMKADGKLKMTLNNRYIVGIALGGCSEKECVINVQR